MRTPREDMRIHFDYKGQNYQVGMEAYDKDCIVLPDNTVVYVNGWFETCPPQPGGISERGTLSLGSTPEETAELLNGVVASLYTPPTAEEIVQARAAKVALELEQTN
jgi:hypothetical protein